MKFMKLGTRPDTLYTKESIRSVYSEVSTDIKIKVQNSLYLLHKFPLLSKCSRLLTLCSERKESPDDTIIDLSDIPGGAEAFEMCVKFCYGITITLSAHNFVTVRCASHYLQMNDDLDKGNLSGKLDVFFKSCILRRWKDTILTLKRTRKYATLCDELGITGHCIESLASKIVSNPSKDDWLRFNKGWWAEDISELGIDHYWRIMLSVKSAGTVSSEVIGEALKVYACRWLPSELCSDSQQEITIKKRMMLEKLVSLLPLEKGMLSCSFLLRLLSAANVLNASTTSKRELARRVGMQLEEATVSDLLIPSPPYASETQYDVDIVTTILEEYMLQRHSPPTSPRRGKDGYERRRSRSAENVEFEGQENSRRSSSASHSSKLRVAKLIDCYLQEIARDANLPMEKLIALAEAVPDFARPDHDDLYKVIDIYLRAHPNLGKNERKKLCRILNCKKLSVEACIHAAQNEMLPLRIIVQALFFEQGRAAMSGGHVNELPNNIKALLAATTSSDDDKDIARLRRINDDWSVAGLKCRTSNLETLKMKLQEAENGVDDEILHPNGLLRSSSHRFKALCSIPSKPKRMLSKLWPVLYAKIHHAFFFFLIFVFVYFSLL